MIKSKFLIVAQFLVHIILALMSNLLFSDFTYEYIDPNILRFMVLSVHIIVAVIFTYYLPQSRTKWAQAIVGTYFVANLVLALCISMFIY